MVLLEQIEALDDALWEVQFKNSEDFLAALADQAHKGVQEGKVVPLDGEEFNQGTSL